MQNTLQLNNFTKLLHIKYPVLLMGLVSLGAVASPITYDGVADISSTIAINSNNSPVTITQNGDVTDKVSSCTYDIDTTWTFINDGKLTSAASGNHSFHYREAGDFVIKNTGSISYTGGKIFVDGDAGGQKFDITNSGTIRDSSNIVFNLKGGSAKLVNESTGKISSDTSTVFNYIGSTGDVLIDNTGEITTAGTAIISNGVTTIHNAGKISGATAISMGSNKDELQLETSSDITGYVNAGSGVDTLTLQGDSGKGSLKLSQYKQFEVFNKNGKGTWELTDTNATGETSDWNLNAGKLIVAKDAIVKGSVNISKDVTENTTLEINGSIDNGSKTAVDFESNTENQLIFNTGASLGAGGMKLGAGKVYLTGTGAVDKPVEINNSTLYIGDAKDGTGGSVATDIKNSGTLVFNRADNYTYDNVINGTGVVEKEGTGNVILTKDQTYTGDTNVKAGALILTNDIELKTANVSVAQNSILGGYGSVVGNVINNGLIAVADAAPGYENDKTGEFTIGGDLTNNGELRMNSVNPASTLTVKGNYTGNNGLLTMDMVLNDDTTSSGDLMVVEGDTAGTTYVTINNAGGLGGQTLDGILVVEVDGQSDGEFIQKGRIVAGAYDYYLQRGTTSNPTNGSWYLRSETPPAPTPEPIPEPAPAPAPAPLRPEAGSYLGNQAAAKDMFMSTLHDRMGEQQLTQDLASDDLVPSTWMRVSGSRTEGRVANIDQATDSSMFQLGNDLTSWSTNGSDRAHFGFLFGYGSAKTDSYSASSRAGSRRSVGKVNGYNVGLYGTWYQDAKDMKGLYIDSSVQYSWFNNETNGEQLASEKYDSSLWQTSIEAGYAFQVNNDAEKALFIEPQAQVIYTAMDTDNFREDGGTYIHANDADGFTTRLGSRIFGRILKNDSTAQPFIEANWWHDTAANSIKMNEDKIYSDTPANYYEVKGGVEGKINNSFHSWVNVGYQIGEDDYSQLTGMVGVKYIW